MALIDKLNTIGDSMRISTGTSSAFSLDEMSKYVRANPMLPTGYTRCNFIRLKYMPIATTVMPNDDCVIGGVFSAPADQINSPGTIFGAYCTTGVGVYGPFIFTNQTLKYVGLWYYYGGGYVLRDMSCPMPFDTVIEMKYFLENGNCRITLNDINGGIIGAVRSHDDDNPTNNRNVIPSPLMIGGCAYNSKGTVYIANNTIDGTFYDAYIYDKVTSRYLMYCIPALDTEGAPCMYDTVNKVAYYPMDVGVSGASVTYELAETEVTEN